MRVVTEDKKIILLIGNNEAEILYGLLNTCLQSFPMINREDEKNGRWSSDRRRMNNMRRELAHFIGITRKEPGEPTKRRSLPKDTQCPNCEKKLRGEKALQMHIEKVHSTTAKES